MNTNHVVENGNLYLGGKRNCVVPNMNRVVANINRVVKKNISHAVKNMVKYAKRKKPSQFLSQNDFVPLK